MCLDMVSECVIVTCLPQDMFKRVDELERAGMTDSLGPQVSPARRRRSLSSCIPL